MNEYVDNRTWRERLHDLANPVDYGENTLPPVSQELVDMAYEFMEEAERRGVDDRITPSWDDDAVDLVVSEGFNGKPWLSVLVGYEDEWTDSPYTTHSPQFITWYRPGEESESDSSRVLGSVDEALDWLLSF